MSIRTFSHQFERMITIAAAETVMRHSCVCSNSHTTIEQSRSNSPKHGKRYQRQRAPHHPGFLLSRDHKHNSWPRNDGQSNCSGEGRKGVQMQGRTVAPLLGDCALGQMWVFSNSLWFCTKKRQPTVVLHGLGRHSSVCESPAAKSHSACHIFSF